MVTETRSRLASIACYRPVCGAVVLLRGYPRLPSAPENRHLSVARRRVTFPAAAGKAPPWTAKWGSEWASVKLVLSKGQRIPSRWFHEEGALSDR